MKYVVFAIMALCGVPYMASLAMNSERHRGWLVTILIFSTILSTSTKINFVSMEHYRGPDRGFEINLTDLTAWALIAAMLIRFPNRIQWVPFNSGWLALLYLLACISTIGAPDKLVAAFSLFKWARAAVIYWCMVNCVRVGFPREAVWRAFLGMGLYMSFLAIKQKYIQHIYRIPGPFDHSNTVPLFINLFLPALVLWGLCDSKLKGWQASLSVIASLGLIVASQSTFSRLGLMLSLGCFLLALVAGNIRARSRRVTIATVCAIVLVVIGGALAAKSIMDRVKNAPESSEEARLEFNMAAKKMAEDHPFGVGVNNFSRVLTADQRYNQYLSVMEDEEQAGVCHHIYNLTAAELGKGGLYVFAIILARFLLLPILPVLRSRQFESLILIGLWLGTIALHISGFMEWVFRITPVTFLYAINCGLSAGYVQVVNDGRRPRVPSHPTLEATAAVAAKPEPTKPTESDMKVSSQTT